MLMKMTLESSPKKGWAEQGAVNRAGGMTNYPLGYLE